MVVGRARRRTELGALVMAFLPFACGESHRPSFEPGPADREDAGGEAGAGGEANETGGAGGTSQGDGGENQAPVEHAGAAGDGTGGDGAGGDATVNAPVCEDDNPCTLDELAETGCQHAPVEDGAPCSDGDFCSLGDRCLAGVCTPSSTLTGPVQELGRVNGFGTGGVLAVGAGRYLFYDRYDLYPTRLTLVGLEGGAAPILDQLQLPTLSFLDTEHARVAAAALGDGLVALGPRSGGKVTLLDTSGDQLEVLSTVAIPAIAGESLIPASFARSEKRLWICANGFFSAGTLFLADLSDLAAPVVTGELPLDANCGAVAVSLDGNRVYVNTPSGVRVVDVSLLESEGTVEVSEPFVPDSGIAVSGAHLLVRSAQQIEIRNESDLSVAATLPIANSLGATLVEDRLFVQGIRTTGTGAEGYLSLYGFTGSELVLLDDVVVEQDRALPSDLGSWSARVAADDEYAVHYWTKRVFRVVDDELVEMSVPGLGSLAQVAQSGTRNVVLEAHRTQRLDLSAPAPFMDATRTYLREAAFRIAPVLYESTTPRKLLFGNDDRRAGLDQAAIWGPDQASGGASIEIRSRSFDEALSLSPSTSFEVPRDISSTLILTDGFLYRLARPPRGSLRVKLERWPRSALPEDGSWLGKPSSVLDLDDSAEFELADTIAYASVDIDQRSERAVVRVHTALAEGGEVNLLYWLDLSSSPPSVLERSTLSGFSGYPQIAGDRLAITVDNALTFRELGLGEVANFAARPEFDLLGSLVEFDGHAVYASGGSYSNPRLFVIPWGDENVDVQVFPMATPARSVAASPSGLLVGSASEILSLSPACED